jgi:predicted nucleic acid-binding protein
MPDDGLLLDTDIVSLFGRRNAPPGLRPWLVRVGIDRLAISYPTLTELMRGAHIKRKDDPERAEQIMVWVRHILAARFSTPEMTPKVAEVYAHMTTEPSLRNMWTVQQAQKSNRMGHDLMLAAVAITHGLPILTGNVSDFLRIHDRFPLPGLYHPLQARWYLPPDRTIRLPSFDRNAHDRSYWLLPSIGGATDKRQHASRPAACPEPLSEASEVRALWYFRIRTRVSGRGSLRYVSCYRTSKAMARREGSYRQREIVDRSKSESFGLVQPVDGQSMSSER